MEMAITLPFVFLGFLLVAIAHAFGEEAPGQKIMFLGFGWLMGIFSIVAVINVARETGYSGIVDLGTGALYIMIPALFLWFIYIVAKTFTEMGSKIFSGLGR
ncbi:MAG: hypothetical protein BRC29_03405 [Nanohaloarchaea archaeon SW_7_43_1]|nr:MAG: hypothetical protein BRC29_03405 [Nanohaloarchaea archaeon SW_7_43_1]